MRCSFIVSTGRTGTQSLARILDQISHGEVAAYHEPSPSRIFRVLSTLRAAGLVSNRLAMALIKRCRTNLVYGGSHSVYVESNNFLFGLCDLLVAQFEDVRILHIVRDPRTYTESHLRHGVFRGIKGIISRFFPYWLIKPRHLGIKTDKSWLIMSQHERLFWFWSLVNRVIGKGCENLGQRYRVVRYEDLFSDKELFVDVLLWLGMPKKLAGAASSLISERYNIGAQPYERVSEAEAEMIERICSDQLALYGYQW